MKNRRLISVLLAALLILIPATAAFAALTPPGRVDQLSWDPAGHVWNGGAGADKGWWEGETATMVAQLRTNVGVQYDLPICLQVFELPLPTKAYAFTKFEPFNTSFAKLALTGRAAPTELPGGQPIPSSFPAPGWDTDDASIWGYNIDISNVAVLGLGEDGCESNEIGVVVTYTRTNNTDDSCIVWGGHIAKEGDTLPAGSPDSDVPAGKSAGFVKGTFQGRLKTAAADKTLNFKVLYGPNAVVLSGLNATGSMPVFALVLGLGAVFVGGAGLARRRSRKAEESKMTEATPNTTSGTYEPPAIVYESDLEVRAGSPLKLPDPLDLPE